MGCKALGVILNLALGGYQHMSEGTGGNQCSLPRVSDLVSECLTCCQVLHPDAILADLWVMTYTGLCAWTLIAVSSGWGVIVVVALLAKYQPLAYNWDKSLDGRCIDETLSYTMGTAIKLVGDSAILILPMPQKEIDSAVSKKLQAAGCSGVCCSLHVRISLHCG